jgi:hypothetical protein
MARRRTTGTLGAGLTAAIYFHCGGLDLYPTLIPEGPKQIDQSRPTLIRTPKSVTVPSGRGAQVSSTCGIVRGNVSSRPDSAAMALQGQ